MFVYVIAEMLRQVFPAGIGRLACALLLGILLASAIVFGFVKTVLILKPKNIGGFIILISWIFFTMFITSKVAHWAFS